MAAAYDYLTLTLGRGRAAWQGFVDHACGEGARAIAAAGGELLGLFSPQLGFHSNEASALVRWPSGQGGPIAAIVEADDVAAWTHDALAPTVRPADGARLRPGGVYVHRWFVVDGGRVADFVDLSRRAWTGFEGTYQTEIFGLFTAERTAADRAADQGRLLLITWYASHAVWEASREQADDPHGLFQQRHALTRTTIGRSCLLIAPART